MPTVPPLISHMEAERRGRGRGVGGGDGGEERGVEWSGGAGVKYEQPRCRDEAEKRESKTQYLQKKKNKNRGKQGRNDRSAIYSSISSGKKFLGAHSEELTFRR